MKFKIVRLANNIKVLMILCQCLVGASFGVRHSLFDIRHSKSWTSINKYPCLPPPFTVVILSGESVKGANEGSRARRRSLSYSLSFVTRYSNKYRISDTEYLRSIGIDHKRQARFSNSMYFIMSPQSKVKISKKYISILISEHMLAGGKKILVSRDGSNVKFL